jgi:hypothetical protein
MSGAVDEGIERMSEHHDALQCEVERLEYSFAKRIGRLPMAPGNCCDMTIDRHAHRIETFAGGRPDTAYMKPHCRWIAYDPAQWAKGAERYRGRVEDG